MNNTNIPFFPCPTFFKLIGAAIFLQAPAAVKCRWNYFFLWADMVYVLKPMPGPNFHLAHGTEEFAPGGRQLEEHEEANEPINSHFSALPVVPTLNNWIHTVKVTVSLQNFFCCCFFAHLCLASSEMKPPVSKSTTCLQWVSDWVIKLCSLLCCSSSNPSDSSTTANQLLDRGGTFSELGDGKGMRLKHRSLKGEIVLNLQRWGSTYSICVCV